MKLRNDFSDEQKALWVFDYWCHAPGKKDGYCKSNEGVSIHHIFHRDSNSTLNGIPLCFNHHTNYTFLNKSELLKIVIKHLLKINYQFNEEDIKFYKKYEQYYE